MITINANTKIGALLKAHPDALETIISIDSKFSKLRNPILRKILASRTTIAMACRIARCEPNDFFVKLKPLGFEIDTETKAAIVEKKPLPAFIISLTKSQIIDLDVREILEEGKDPLNIILAKIKSIKVGEALKVINTFEPAPLIIMLEKQGFEVYADVIDDNLVETYFFKKSDKTATEFKPKDGADSGWDEVLERFANNLISIDVRELQMPQPMLSILEALENLPDGKALFVYHKRIPVFLLPELSERNLDYRINEISDGNVNMLIFRN